MSRKHFSLNDMRLDKMKIKFVYVSQSKAGEDWHSNTHYHHFTEIFYVVDGRGNFILNDNVFNVKKDDLIIVNPYINHTEEATPDHEFEYIVLGVEGITFKNNDSLVDEGFSLLNYEDYKHEVLFYLQTIIHEVEAEDYKYKNICQNLLEVLIINILRRTTQKIEIAPVERSNREITFVKNYIDEHFAEDITLDDLAEKAYVNKYYLSHSFKKFIGVSPINYLIDRRIEEAKKILRSTNMPIAEISRNCGFSSQSYFSQIFKKRTNLTPNQYRRNSRNINDRM